ncbi:ABC transporter permease [Homoserinimonas sp. A447]
MRSGQRAAWYRRINFVGMFVPVVVIVGWQVASVTVLNIDFLPSPFEIGESFWQLLMEGQLVPPIVHSLVITIAAAAIAIVAGVILGSAIALVPFVRNYTLGTVDVLRSLPVVALMPIALLIWGPTGTTELYVAIFSSLWPITINTIGGVSQIHPRLLEVARSFRLNDMDTFRKIVFPAALPSILVGARLAVIHALVVVIVGELLMNPQGIGGRIFYSQLALQPAQMWVWIIISGLIGYLLNAGMIAGVQKALPGGGSALGRTS